MVPPGQPEALNVTVPVPHRFPPITLGEGVLHAPTKYGACVVWQQPAGTVKV